MFEATTDVLQSHYGLNLKEDSIILSDRDPIQYRYKEKENQHGPALDLEHLEVDPETQYIKHCVLYSDTIQGLCLKYGTRSPDIKKINSLWNETALFSKKVILIPVTTEELQRYLDTKQFAFKRSENLNSGVKRERKGSTPPHQTSPKVVKNTPQVVPTPPHQPSPKVVKNTPQVVPTSPQVTTQIPGQEKLEIRRLKKEDLSRLRGVHDTIFDL